MTESAALKSQNLEDTFSVWIDPMSTITAPVVIAGAGLSYGLVPTADEYGMEIGKNVDAIESALGLSTAIIPIDAKSLYEWAGSCVNSLLSQGMQESEAKLKLAREMGLTSDARFLSKANVPSRGTTPRHRVLSRLAREGRITSFWSFNWDCWLETSLESVGIQHGQRNSRTLAAPQGWRLRYLVWFSGASSLFHTDTMPVFKAHGCVQALYHSQGEFVVTAEEMAKPLSAQPPARTTRMRKELSDSGVIAIGWSATEGYVKELFGELSDAGTLSGQLAIVDLNTSQEGHLQICKSYNVDSALAGITVNGSGSGTTDSLLLWIQTSRAYRAVRAACSGVPQLEAALDADVPKIRYFDEPNFQHDHIVLMVDNWLPAWLRLCFFVRAQVHRFTAGNEFDVLPTERRDAHIPWAPLSDRRDDLMSALSIFRLINKASSAWDYETFPGGLWNKVSQELIFPVPIWAMEADVSTTKIRSVVNAWRDRPLISSIKLLPLDAPLVPLLTSEEKSRRIQRWKESLAGCFGHQHLSIAENYEDAELEALCA